MYFRYRGGTVNKKKYKLTHADDTDDINGKLWRR